MATETAERRDEAGRAHAGSMLQVQIYVNKRHEELNRAILPELGLVPEPVIEWKSPLTRDRYQEGVDGRFLEMLDLGHLRNDLKKFWPRSGPRWDGLAVLKDRATGQPVGYLLVEGKSYPAEVYGGGCKSPSGLPNRKLIDNALKAMSVRLGLTANPAWHGRLYQYANRLAHVVFLQEHTNLPVWLVNLCFLDDPHRQTARAEWETGLKAIKQEFGVESGSIPHAIDVILPARSRAELVS